ncbi:MAG: DinB family protein [Balneolaceae bacterium]
MAIPSSITYTDMLNSLQSARSVVEEYRGIPTDTMEMKLNPETWSCTEICQHLIRFNTLYLERIEQALEAPVNGAAKERFSVGWLTRSVARMMKPPYRFRIKTIAPMLPSKLDLSTAETLQYLIDTENRFISLIEVAETNRTDLEQATGRNPIFKFSMSVPDFFIFFDTHQRRHFWQIEQILKRLPK